MSSSKPFSRNTLLKAGLAAFLALAPVMAEARLGGGSSSGSRGARTQSAPAPTQTAPSAAQPMQRTTTPQASPSAAARPQAAPAPSGGFLSGGFGRGLLGGLLGAGLIGMFMGHGMMGGLGGIMSMLGLLLQVALIGGLIMFAWSWFARRRQGQPAMAGGMMGGQQNAFGGAPQPVQSAGFGSGIAGGAPQAAQTVPIKLKDEDFPAFERLLTETQLAYGAEDMSKLRKLSTEEMVYYFQADIDESKKKGVASKISDVKLLQGDLSEAWREGRDEYATVAMRFSLVDVTVDRATGRTVEGDPAKPVEATEVWTFLRPVGTAANAWQLSAIQQAA